MSIIRNIQCNACGFVLLHGTGTALYVKKPAGFLRKLIGLGDRKTIVPDSPVGKIPGGRGIRGHHTNLKVNSSCKCTTNCR